MQEPVEVSEALKTKYPEQVVVAIARDANGKDNPITLGWTMICSSVPLMMAIAVGKGRYSLETIRRAGEFVLAFPASEQAEEVLAFGTTSGRDVDKFAEAGTAVSPATDVRTVLLDEAVANFECKLVDQTETGDHIVLFGRVLAAHRNPDRTERLYTVAPGFKLGGVAAC